MVMTQAAIDKFFGDPLQASRHFTSPTFGSENGAASGAAKTNEDTFHLTPGFRALVLGGGCGRNRNQVDDSGGGCRSRSIAGGRFYGAQDSLRLHRNRNPRV